MVEITDKVPIVTSNYEKWKSVLETLQVGQSFAVEKEERQLVRFCAWKYFHQRDKKTGLPISNRVFAVKIDVTNPSGHRCWRVE